MSETFRLIEDSLQHRFLKSRAKLQVYAGGFANGKTATACIKGLELAKEYPGSNGLIARSTYPKLNDTIRKEWLKWCPPNWIKSFPQSKNSDNTCKLTNGTFVNFRYIEQQGKGQGESVSNLLSATYDWIIIDQIEDPEITAKDFDDLFGRLRGQTPYIGEDPDMPDTGPRIFIVTCNPTRNWFYKKIIRPFHQWLIDKKYHAGLFCDTDEEGKPIIDKNGHAKPLMEVYEGSTYENKENLSADYIKTLESLYTGSMRKRFLLGEWAGYEGLIYPSYRDTTHSVGYPTMLGYLFELRRRGFTISWIEGFDHGIAVPSCYMLAFVDPLGKVHIVDGFYQKELSINDILYGNKDIEFDGIKAIRAKYIEGGERDNRNWIQADPSIFRRAGSTMKTVGPPISDLMWDNGHGVKTVRANNDIINGIRKVQEYVEPRELINPYTGEHHSPHLFFSEHLAFIDQEFSDYYWNKDTSGDAVDKPIDKNDHAMDTIKYLLSDRPSVSELSPDFILEVPSYMMWQQAPEEQYRPMHRYG